MNDRTFDIAEGLVFLDTFDFCLTVIDIFIG